MVWLHFGLDVTWFHMMTNWERSRVLDLAVFVYDWQIVVVKVEAQNRGDKKPEIYDCIHKGCMKRWKGEIENNEAYLREVTRESWREQFIGVELSLETEAPSYDGQLKPCNI